MSDPGTADSDRGPDSARDLARTHSDRLAGLFDALDLGWDGLDSVRRAVDEGDIARAGEELVAYYRGEDTAAWLRDPAPGDADLAAADAVLDGEFTFQGVTGSPSGPDGLDWEHRGPNDDAEWAYFLNRHPYFRTLLEAWAATGEDAYAAAFDGLLTDWVLANPAPDGEVRRAPWRTLEAAIRLNASWPEAFYGFQEAAAFTSAGRLLLLSSVPEHAAYLRANHTRGSNWTVMEARGLARAAVCWPEFADADGWFARARDVLAAELDDQVYPDGAQDELTAGYHEVALRNFEGFVRTAERGGRALPGAFGGTLDSMWAYLAGTVRPDGTTPLNNDSDRKPVAGDLLETADRYDRPAWRYAASNGDRGERPADPPSRHLPWAGHLVSRSGWDRDAQWSFFDAGPWGTGHQHNDKLHLSVAAGGRDLLVDSGRFAYSGDLAERFRSSYARHSRGHNVVLVDGAGQGPGPEEASEPAPDAARIAPTHDSAAGTFDAGFPEASGEAVHDRAVCYRRGAFWVVLDRVRTDRARTLEPLWHFHPRCTVAVEGSDVVTADGGEANLRVTPAGGVDWRVELRAGASDPPQGWYSERYNEYEPATAAVYGTDADGTAVFAWALVPGDEPAPEGEVGWVDDPTGDRATLEVHTPAGAERFVADLGDEGLWLAPDQ